jgi:hypothetical protein
MRKIAIALFAVVLASSSSIALQVSNILGKWCGAASNMPVTNLVFTRDSLTVTWLDTNQRSRFTIDGFRADEKSVVVLWQLDGKTLETTYSEFSAKNTRMVQLANEKGPRYIFHRC